MIKKITVLGSTGSIGKNTLRVIENHPEEFEVFALCAHSNTDLLLKQASKFKPKLVCLTGSEYSKEFVDALPKHTQAVFGKHSYKQAVFAGSCDLALLAFVGISGLPALIECIDNDIPVALANKEALVCGGEIVRKKLNEKNVNLLPVDSELSAIFQSLGGVYDTSEVRRLILTASGGPFRTWDSVDIYNATPEKALKHPNWNMGKKISIDCATMINKGLEVMETRWLFDVSQDMIDIIIHPQSVVHSMAEFNNGAVIAHMSNTDMAHAIQYALSYPKKLKSIVGYMEFQKLSALNFYSPDYKKFPCLKLAIECLADSQGACVVLNSANEVAVEAFLKKQIVFGKIYEMICYALDNIAEKSCKNIENVYEIDILTRNLVYNKISSL